MALGQALVQIRIINEIPKEKASNGVEVEVPMPKCVSRVLCESSGKGTPLSPFLPSLMHLKRQGIRGTSMKRRIWWCGR